MLRLGVRLTGPQGAAMSANILVLRAGEAAGRARDIYPEAPIQGRLALVVLFNLAAVAASFYLENMLLPWRARMDTTTPGWCFVLAQASALGLAIAIATRGGSFAVVQALLAATLLGYAYTLSGAWLIDPRRALQYAHLIFRAVEMGLVSVAAMALGIAMKLMLHQRLALAGDAAPKSARHFYLGQLMFLIGVFAVGLWLVNLFFDHFDRETQLAEIVQAIVRSFPAALPWLWLVLQPRPMLPAIGVVLGITLIVMAVKVFIASLTGDELPVILLQATDRAAAYALGAALNGLLLRGLGFRWIP
jgi:hypothetical protein